MTPTVKEISEELIYWLILEDQYGEIAKKSKRGTKERREADAVIKEARYYKKKNVRLIRSKLGGIFDLP